MNRDLGLDTGSQHALGELAKRLQSGRAVAFVGAGASAGMYPLWNELISQLADQAVSMGWANEKDRTDWLDLALKDPEQAVRGIRKALDDGIYYSCLKELFGPRQGADGRRFTPVHERLLQLPFRGYVTTNYDPCLLEARQHVRPECPTGCTGIWKDDASVRDWHSGDVFQEGVCPILYLHGYYERPETIVLGADEYREAYRSSLYGEVLKTLWTRDHLVFVGFGFRDRWLDFVAETVLTDTKARLAGPRHIALVGVPEGETVSSGQRRRMLDKYHALLLTYRVKTSSDGGQDHSHLLEVLRSVGVPRPAKRGREKKQDFQFMPRKRNELEQLGSDQDRVDLPDDRRTDVFDVRLQPNSTGFQTIQLDTGPSRPEEQLDALGAPPSSPTDTVADDSSGLTSPPENASSDYPRTSETQTSATPNPKVSFIAHELVQVVCELLESEEEPYRTLRTELVRRVAGKTEEARIDVEFFVRALCEKLNDVMSVLRMWLDSNNRIEGVEDVRRVVDAVASTGFDAEWVQELLDELEGRHLHVPIETDLYLCEVIFTALYRRPATWIHERAIDHEELLSIATPSNTPKSRAREIRRRMVETYFKDRISKHVGESDRDYKERLNKWAENDLPSVLESEREDQKPWFVLFLETVDALKNDMEIDPELWSGIVKLERSRTTGQFVCDRAKLQNRLVVIHQRLRELDDQAHKGPR